MNCTALINASDSNHVNVDFSIWTLNGDDMNFVVTIVPSAESVWSSYLASIVSCLAPGPCLESITYSYDLWICHCSSLTIRSWGSPRLSRWGGSRRWSRLWRTWRWTFVITMWNSNSVTRSCCGCSSHSWSSVDSNMLASRCRSSCSWCARSWRCLHPTWSWSSSRRTAPLVIDQIQRKNMRSLIPFIVTVVKSMHIVS